MSDHAVRIPAAVALCAVLAVGGGCGPAEEATDRTVRAETTGQGAEAEAGGPAAVGPRGPARNGSEQDFLDDLTAFGLPTEMTAATTVEVGIGICRSISDGSDTETILDHLRPLTSAIAAQDPERDTAEVGRAIIDASRAHLCG
ncbi:MULTISPECIES: DUF732 domain-containing protein [Dietzia]|uniref:DUF732 domain-containing protein n=3 Tax=Dietzia TaxID=37914 RepID=A0A2A2WTE5_9ACTN|nr:MULTISPECIES: DUF732 domain-containing protein [Dietzia]MBC7296101.1 DUF732 domain-containing protein [Dietzia sp.]MBB1037036.1 DUF732 domain-containing protein [Dietzia natronolimnaea]MBB1049055.1 DUF732 domain-containing protein [Dietzia cercidiphylli]MBB1049699.1 DUF732 domain-containing protein [Dietzia sp. CW19]MBB1056121.1 DUF732 domain-containing protein [Dietzia sp. B19]